MPCDLHRGDTVFYKGQNDCPPMFLLLLSVLFFVCCYYCSKVPLLSVACQ